MNLQNQSNVSGQGDLLPEMILMEVPMLSPIWSLLVQSGWRMVDAKDNKVLLVREYVEA